MVYGIWVYNQRDFPSAQHMQLVMKQIQETQFIGSAQCICLLFSTIIRKHSEKTKSLKAHEAAIQQDFRAYFLNYG
jgi:hypothetical protein